MPTCPIIAGPVTYMHYMYNSTFIVLSGDPVVPDDHNTYVHVDKCDDNVYDELLPDNVYSTIKS